MDELEKLAKAILDESGDLPFEEFKYELEVDAQRCLGLRPTDAEIYELAMMFNIAPPNTRPVRPAAGRSKAKKREPIPDLNKGGSVNAPYEFSALAERIAMPEPVIAKALGANTLHNKPLRDGYSGTLTVDWKFDGPMLIGAGNQETASDVDFVPQTLGKRPVIPGSTLRGLLRSTMEIAAMGRLEQTDMHRAFSIRDFAHELFQDAQNAVQTGWLTPCPDHTEEMPKYQIQPCEHSLIWIRDLPTVSDNAEGHGTWLKTGLLERYRMLNMASPDPDEKIVDFSVRQHFRKATITRQNGYSRQVVQLDKAGSLPGTFVVTDCLSTFNNTTDDQRKLDEQDQSPEMGNLKKYETVFFETTAEPIPVPDDDWRDFISINCSQSDHNPKPEGNWEKLKPTLSGSGRIPVFYVQDQNSLDFGLARVFKRKLQFRVKDKLPEPHRLDPGQPYQPDFVTALFGYVREPEPGASEADIKRTHRERHLKSRVSIGFAKLGSLCKASNIITMKASAPRPSYGPFYLRGTPLKDWHSLDCKIAGRKRYPAFKGTNTAVYQAICCTKGSANMESKLRFLEPKDDRKPLHFRGDIRLHNVTAAEIGALIWVLTLGENKAARHAIGRAKAQGAGQARVSNITAILERNDGVQTPVSTDDCLNAFEAHMRKTDSNWPDVEGVQDLLASTLPKTSDERNRSYMKLKEFRDLRSDAYNKGAGHLKPDRLLVPKKG